MTNRLKVLLVEDDEDDFVLTRDHLEESSQKTWEVIWASSYAKGIDALGKDQWDAILVDYYLGERDGVEFVRDAQARSCPAPIIILTGQGDMEIDHAAMRAGAMDYLEKGQISGPLLERSLRFAVERAKALQTLLLLAIHDDLTGLYNRREFDRLLGEEISRCQRTGRPMALIMLDIDRFKQINDTRGHQIGDGVLRHVSQILRNMVRIIDRVARYGGDEFAIILPETSAKGAFFVANRLTQAFAEAPFLPAGAESGVPQIGISLSLGVAEYPADATDAVRLVGVADKALYIAKGNGGNQAAVCRMG